MENDSKKKIRICHITTSDVSLANLFRGQHRFFLENSFDVWGVSAPGALAERAVREEGIKFFPVDFCRSMSVCADLRCLFRLIRFLRRESFDIVEAGTGKAGPIAMVAALLAGVRNRVFTLHGVWYDEYRGLKRLLASMVDKIACVCARRVFVVSHELRQRYIDHGLLESSKAFVIRYGSCNGVDVNRFSRNKDTLAAAVRIRNELSIPDSAFVLGFVGRASINKGIRELAAAFQKLQETPDDNIYLLIVGPFDYMGGATPKHIIDYFEDSDRVECVGMVDDVENYYAAIDLLVLPSYREGFGNVNIEAAAMGVPVVATDICGCRESVSDGHTGILVEPKNSQALYNAIVTLIGDRSLRDRLAANGPQWVAERFLSEDIWEGFLRQYLDLVGKAEHVECSDH